MGRGSRAKRQQRRLEEREKAMARQTVQRENDEIIDTEISLQKAVAFLSGCSTLVVDCEGLFLGIEGGVLSFVGIRNVSYTTPPRSYLFDILVLERSGCSLYPLFQLLFCETIQKVFYDGRMDFCAFYFQYGVVTRNVIDLQVADLYTRFTLEDKKQLLKRMSFQRVCPGKDFKAVHFLLGLNACLVKHKVPAPRKVTIDHGSWLKRPLPQNLRSYAGNDLYLISLLLEHFQNASYLPPELPEWSQRYVSVWADSQPYNGNFYRLNPFLPLEILPFVDENKGKVAKENPQVSVGLKRCTGCLRMLSSKSFSSSREGLGADKGYCVVCLAVQVWCTQKTGPTNRRQKVTTVSVAGPRKGVAPNATNVVTHEQKILPTLPIAVVDTPTSSSSPPFPGVEKSKERKGKTWRDLATHSTSSLPSERTPQVYPISTLENWDRIEDEEGALSSFGQYHTWSWYKSMPELQTFSQTQVSDSMPWMSDDDESDKSIARYGQDSASSGSDWGYNNEDTDTSNSGWGRELTENANLQSMGSYSSGRSLDWGYGVFYGNTDEDKAENSTELQSKATTSKTLSVSNEAHGAATLEKSNPVKESTWKAEPCAERDRSQRSRRRKTRNAADK